MNFIINRFNGRALTKTQIEFSEINFQEIIDMDIEDARDALADTDWMLADDYAEQRQDELRMMNTPIDLEG